MNVAFIPVRGGSKSIPLKNIKEICGKPLVYWTALAASKCTYIDKVYVATDSEEIKASLEQYSLEKLQVIDRSAENATDTASTESVMLEFAEKYDFDNIVLIQATSPLLLASDLDLGFTTFMENGTDSVLSVVRQKRFHWKISEDGFAEATNYDVFRRPRRQEFEGYLVENGAFYITSKEALLKSKNRISGKIKAVEMPEETFVEIDEPSDFLVVEELMKKRLNKDSEKKKIRMFLTDCDGCLTDGGMYYTEDGKEMKKFNTRDGMGIQMLREKDIIVGIVTGESTKIVEHRAEKLHMDEVHLGVKNKVEKVKAISEKYGISLDEVAYVGDDINDVGVLEMVGYPCCVRNAVDEVKKVAKYISNKDGGDGAVRDIVEQVLARNKNI